MASKDVGNGIMVNRPFRNTFGGDCYIVIEEYDRSGEAPDLSFFWRALPWRRTVYDSFLRPPF